MELTRDVFGAASRRELDTKLSVLSAGAVLELVGPGASFEGVAAIGGVAEDWRGPYGDFGIEIEDVVAFDNGVAFAPVRQGSRLVDSAGLVGQREAWIFLWGDGLIVRASARTDIAEARAAAEHLAKERG